MLPQQASDNGMEGEVPSSLFTKTEATCDQSSWRFPRTLCHAKRKLIRAFSYFFGVLAEFVFDHTLLVMIIPIVVCLILGTGFFRREEETHMNNLYALPNTPSTKAADDFVATFAPERYISVIVSSKDNILTESVIRTVAALDSKITNITVSSDEVVEDEFHTPLSHSATDYEMPARYTHEDICIKDASGHCNSISILDVYNSPSMYGQPLITMTYPFFYGLAKKKVYFIDAIAGNITSMTVNGKQANITTVQNATAFQMLYALDGSQRWKDISSTYEAKLLDMLRTHDMGDLKLSYAAERSINDELYVSSTMDRTDVLRLAVGIALLTAYGMLTKASFNYRHKLFSVFVGVMSSLLGYLGGAGMLYLLGVKHVPPAEATPFLVVGIGADDCFVLISSYSLLYMNKSARDRIKLTLQSAGLSITITTATNIAAFFIGWFSPYNSISVFCLTTAVSLGMAYLTCLTLFLGFLCVDARREEREMCGYDLACFTATSKQPWEKGVSFKEAEPTNIDLNESMPDEDVAASNESVCSEDEGEVKELNMELTDTSGALLQHMNSQTFSASIYDVATIIVSHKVAERHSKRVLKNRKLKQLREMTSDRSNSLPETQEEETGTYSRTSNNETTLKCLKGDDETTSKNFLYEIDNACPPSLIKDCFHQNELLNECYSCRANEVLRNEGYEMTNNRSIVNVKRLSSEANQRIDSKARKQMKLEQLARQYSGLSEPEGNTGILFRKFITEYYGRFICNPYVKPCVLLLFVVHFGFAMYGFSRMESGLSVNDITLPNSYLREYYKDAAVYLSAYGDKYSIFFTGEAEWHTKTVQAELLSLHDSIKTTDAVALTNGMQQFLQTNAADLQDISKEEFNQKLFTWLHGQLVGKMFQRDFKFDESNRTLLAWKFTYYMPYTDNTMKSYTQMKAVRDLLDSKNAYFSGQAYSPVAVLWESDNVILSMTLKNLAVAIVTVTMISFAFIPGIMSSILSMIMIICVDFSLFGYMSYWGLKLNMLTMVTLLISIGFSVDYTVHMVHTFTHCKSKSKSSRVIQTLVIMGYPLTDGVISTFLPVAVLSAAPKMAMLVFFKMMTLVLIFAYAQGIILLPVLFFYCSPNATADVYSTTRNFFGLDMPKRKTNYITPEMLVI